MKQQRNSWSLSRFSKEKKKRKEEEVEEEEEEAILHVLPEFKPGN
jgi:hypothetical protein